MQQGVLQNVRSNRKSTCTAHVHSRSSRRRDAGGGSRQFTVWEKPAAEKLLVSAAQGVKKLKVYRLLPAQAAFRRYTALLWSSLSASDGCNNVHAVRDFPNMRSYGANPPPVYRFMSNDGCHIPSYGAKHPRCTVLCRTAYVMYRHMAINALRCTVLCRMAHVMYRHMMPTTPPAYRFMSNGACPTKAHVNQTKFAHPTWLWKMSVLAVL